MKRMLGALAIALAALAAGCGGGGDVTVQVTADAVGGELPAPGSLRRAPSDPSACGYEHVYVTVMAVRIQDRPGGGPGTATELTLAPARRIDLLHLGDGLLRELGLPPLSAGRYAQVQLVLSANTGAEAGIANAVQPAGGSPLPLAIQGSGGVLKLQRDFDVPAGALADLALDFNACRSVVSAGHGGRYLLKSALAAHPMPAAAVVDSAEHQVNTTTAGAQVQPDVAVLTGGGPVVVWSSPAPAGGATRIYARRYAPGGDPVGGETPVSAATATDQAFPSVAALADGGHVVAWAVLDGVGAASGRGLGIRLQRFGSDGAPIGAEQQVDTQAALEQTRPHVAGLAGGGYVVVWKVQHSTGGAFPGALPGIVARRYGADGIALGPEQGISSSYWLADAAVTPLADGGYVVAWDVMSKTTMYVYLARFDAAGGAAGPLRQVTNWGERPAVAALRGGGYVLAWRSLAGVLQTQRYGADDTPLGGAVGIDPTGGDPGEAAVATMADGGYLVTWTANHADTTGKDVYARRYGADGSPAGAMRVNLTTLSDQQSSRVAAGPAGGFAVTWLSLGQDGDSWGVFERQFDAGTLR
ncbi:DUF4382 domain-containing protein [Ramlibacter sp.]|uniref:DUF4382 domain-containing protein n=1 Tax=Ramlibacter sp. TaxID=1917967 RepID=UPI002CF8FC72|nr:DUF4382 domain-containing protein [Ramlibacter sp.]HWI82299.1 DUF4382 domain-containing protein [Ramlibacter sp.]